MRSTRGPHVLLGVGVVSWAARVFSPAVVLREAPWSAAAKLPPSARDDEIEPACGCRRQLDRFQGESWRSRTLRSLRDAVIARCGERALVRRCNRA